jgi:hypothetical protein
MKHFADEWILEWCQDNGWTDPVMQPVNCYWAFPPGGVMPQPIPLDSLRLIKAQKGLSPAERKWSISAVAIALLLAGVSYVLKTPMPLLGGFAFAALTVARLDMDEL